MTKTFISKTFILFRVTKSISKQNYINITQKNNCHKRLLQICYAKNYQKLSQTLISIIVITYHKNLYIFLIRYFNVFYLLSYFYVMSYDHQNRSQRAEEWSNPGVWLVANLWSQYERVVSAETVWRGSVCLLLLLVLWANGAKLYIYKLYNFYMLWLLLLFAFYLLLNTLFNAIEDIYNDYRVVSHLSRIYWFLGIACSVRAVYTGPHLPL